MALSGKIVSGAFDVEVDGKKLARKTDLTDHAALITSGEPTVVAGGTAFHAARISDKIACPITTGPDGPHVGGTILTGSGTVKIGGQWAARLDDSTLCDGPGAGGGGGGGGGAGGSGGPEEPESECAKLWKKYENEANALIAPGDDDHRKRNKIISAAYADLYLGNPDLQWAGLAAYASKQVGCAMDHALKIAPEPMHPPPYRGDEAMQAAARYTYDKLGEGNRALFLDIYPTHRFFQEHGFAKLAQCGGERRPPLPAQAVDGFRALDLYRRTGDKKYLRQHVASVAWHEQVNVLQRDIYNDPAMQGILRLNEVAPTSLGASPASVVMGSGCTDPTGGKQTLVFGDKGRTRIYDVHERMDWILGDVAGYYQGIVGTPQHSKDLREIREVGRMAGGMFDDR